VLAALLEPARYLQYGAAVAVLFACCCSARSELTAMAKIVAEQVKQKVHGTLDCILLEISQRKDITEMRDVESMFELRARITEQSREKTNLVNSTSESVNDTSGLDAYQKWNGDNGNPKARKVVTPSDIFSLLDVSGDGSLDRNEFERLFSSVDTVIPDHQVENFFNMCDTNGSGTISQEEFEDGWENLKEAMIKEYMATLGASNTDIFFIVLLVVLNLSCLFAFIFLALQGWYSAQAFDAAIQSCLLGVGGWLQNKFRKKAKFEDQSPAEQASSIEDVAEGDGDGG